MARARRQPGIPAFGAYVCCLAAIVGVEGHVGRAIGDKGPAIRVDPAGVEVLAQHLPPRRLRSAQRRVAKHENRQERSNAEQQRDVGVSRAASAGKTRHVRSLKGQAGSQRPPFQARTAVSIAWALGPSSPLNHTRRFFRGSIW